MILRTISQIIICLAIIIFATACGKELREEAQKIERESGGVILRFEKWENSLDRTVANGFLENTNDFPVLIKSVWVSDRGEVTIAVDSVSVHGKLEIKSLRNTGAFFTPQVYGCHVYRGAVGIGYLDSKAPLDIGL